MHDDILTREIPAPTEWPLQIAEVTVPLTHAIGTLAFDLAKAQAEVRAWQQAFAAQTEQIAALRAKLAEKARSGA